MPIKIPNGLPAISQLEHENIFVMNAQRAESQDIRTMRIAVVNLMPVKETTETDLLRLLSNTPLQVEIDFIRLETHHSKNTNINHLDNFYRPFSSVKDQKYDGLIVTGAPIEHLPFESVSYWEEMKEVLDWSKDHVTSSMFICWASQAALYHFYGLEKHPLRKKLSGVYPHTLTCPTHPILRGFDDLFYIPHSRNSEVKAEDIKACSELEIISTSPEAGVYMVMSRDSRQLFVSGHAEYARKTLKQEFDRDQLKGLEPKIPANYFPNNDPSETPQKIWASHAHLLFSNWLNYHVYQLTPYIWS
ncbi:homoserine O-succinyltransferase [Halosquirtibacter xylanolyticus]|uniref:homoserine O-acetyltransferase MetA n=1 Tax=Halosquirtibacter xylanolyticus TaxID=3374599 RepID=UPI0037484C3A|nr:homoserine O-succinyltransferase [Prolixibacteraceae bacterium]